MSRICLIAADEALAHLLSGLLARQGRVEVVADTAAALPPAAGFDLIVLVHAPETDALDTLRRLRAASIPTPVIIVAAHAPTAITIEAMKLGAYDLLPAPPDPEEFARVAADALRLHRELSALSGAPAAPAPLLDPDPRIVGSSLRMQEVFKLVGQVAEKDVTVLLTGESGTGKELIARALWRHSARRDRPFLAVNCAAIPETLFESELFGYERGAFTGAEQAHQGKFERAHSGTLFFDEVGDLSPATQAKVLRVLQEGEFERVGGNRTIKVDVRLIAATNQDLERAIGEGRFRADLFWRLNVISITLPPLRDRRDDLPALVEYFIGRFAREYQKPARRASDAALRRLSAYAWPGNVRELENVLRRAVLLCPGEVLGEEQLSLPDAGADDATLQTLSAKLEQALPEIMRLSPTHRSVIEVVEKILIEKTLRACGGNQVQAAKALGISRNTLRQRMTKYNL